MAEIIVVHGVPGAGKSTHSRHLSQFTIGGHEIYHISAGERLRAIRMGEFNSHFKSEVNDPNATLPLEHKLVNDVMFEYISICPSNSVILVDGYPRFEEAVDSFTNAIKDGNHKLLGCLHLHISQETSLSRLAGRGVRKGERIHGITPDVVEKRYREHEVYTKRAIEALREYGPIIEIESETEELIVWESFKEAVVRLMDII